MEFIDDVRLDSAHATTLVFCGSYIVEKMQLIASVLRHGFHLLAMMLMAIPGMGLGLFYIFFFNEPDNPFNGLYGTMAILVMSSIVHFFTVAYLAALAALEQLDPEFEPISECVKEPPWRVFRLVGVPVCLPVILDLAVYLFCLAMTTVSAVVLISSALTTLAAKAVLNMDDAGDTAPAAAMGMMIPYTNVAARLWQAFCSRALLCRIQAWRQRCARGPTPLPWEPKHGDRSRRARPTRPL